MFLFCFFTTEDAEFFTENRKYKLESCVIPNPIAIGLIRNLNTRYRGFKIPACAGMTNLF